MTCFLPGRKPMIRGALLLLSLSTGLTVPHRALAQTGDAVERILAAPELDPAAADRLYNDAVIRGALPALIARLDAMTREGPAHRRAMAALLRGSLFWQAGDREQALAATGQAVEFQPGAESWLARAELLDATGEVSEAVDLYRKVLSSPVDAALRVRIEQRPGLIEAMRRPDMPASLAAGRPAGQIRNLSIVLDLLGRPKSALSLARTVSAAGMADHLHRAQWALASGNIADAEAEAGAAFDAARNEDDRRYALALATEAFRDAGNLAGAIAFLDSKPAGPAVADMRVNVLLELGKVQAALALIGGSDMPQLRDRLINVLDMVGDREAREREYRRLIAADPRRADLYARLAALYLADGEEARAVAVFRDLFAANRGKAEILIAGARAMIGMGLHDQAITLVTDMAADPSVGAAAHMFLFETYLDRGENTRALGELQAVRQLDRNGTRIGDIADGYERLGRADDALALLRTLEAKGGPIGYDRRARMAQLAEATGDDADALRRWRALWTETQLPARRRYIERQIVTLAQRMNQLEPMAQALSARLDAGTIGPEEIDLLVALRLAQNRPDAAADVVRRFAAASGMGEAERLDRLVRLYGQMHDYAQLEQTLRRLIAIDPRHRDTNIRQLILTMLRSNSAQADPTQRQATLDALMARLSDADDAGGHAFRATVYRDAGLEDQALVQLRRGLATAPQDPDALLQLAAGIKQQGRRDIAIGLLQYAALHGPAPLFPAAIEGLIDMLADDSGDSAASKGVFGWTERMLLDRILAMGADRRRLGLLADLASVEGDVALQLRATEEQVPDAGDQRAFVLRELFTLAGDGAQAGGSVSLIGDPARRPVYARRLLALGKSFPPDLYSEIARTLLMQGDVAGAERAFAMMGGLGGLVNVAEAKGDAYAAAGLPEKALANYGRALLQDQTNLDLLVKTSILREREGKDALARTWYWRGLRTLIARQPRNAAANAEQSLDVRRYYATLVEGLLLTWPDDPAAVSSMLGELQGVFGKEIAAIDPADRRTLADHPRLALLVDLGLRIMDAQKGGAVLTDWPALLEQHFASDAEYLRAAAWRRDLIGTADAVPAGPDWPLAALKRQAEDGSNRSLLFALALTQGDRDSVRRLLDDTLAEEERARSAPHDPADSTIREPVYLLLLAQAMDQLSDAEVRSLILVPLSVSPVHDAVLFDLFRAAPDRYDRLQTIAGSPLIAPDALIRLIITQSDRPLGIALRNSRNSGGNGVEWLDHMSVDQIMMLYAGLVDRRAHGDGDSGLVDMALEALFRRPLDPDQRARLAALLHRDLGIINAAAERSPAPLIGRLLRFDALPANRDLVLRAAADLAARYPQAAALPDMLQSWYAGDVATAFARFAALANTLRAAGDQLPWFDQAMTRAFPDMAEKQVAAFLADPGPNPAAAKALYQRVSGSEGAVSIRQQLALTRRMIAIDPDDPAYRMHLLSLLVGQQDWASAVPVLRDYVVANPDDRPSATILAILYRLTGQSDRAEAVAREAGIDPDDADWLTLLLNRSRMARSQGGTGPVALFDAGVYQAYSERFATLPALVAVRAREQGSAASADSDSPLGPLITAARHDSAAVPGVLRGWWRETAPGSDADMSGRARWALIRTLTRASDDGGEGAALLARSDVGAELRRYPGAMPPESRAHQMALYDLGAYGPVQRGEAATALNGALADLGTGKADMDSIYRVLALADRTKAEFGPDDIAAIDARLRVMPALAPETRVVIARIYARGGDMQRAETFLRAALLQLLYPSGALDNVDDVSAALADISDSLMLWGDRADALRVRQGLALILQKRKLGPGGGDLPDLPALQGNGASGR